MFRYDKRLPALALVGMLALFLAPEARAQTAKDVSCNKCVEKRDLAKNAVVRNRIKNNAVTGAKVKDGSLELADLSPSVLQLITDLQAQLAAVQIDLGTAQTDIGTLQGQVAAAESDVDTLEAQVATLQGQVAAAESDIDALQQGAPTFAFLDFVRDLAALVTVDVVDTDLNGNGVIENFPVDLDGDGSPDAASELLPTVRFEGVNLQVVNGDMSGSTQSRNGLGNLIVGYNEARIFGDLVCSNGFFDNMTDCVNNGRVWARDHKSGSHYLVVGTGNAYSQSGGVVFGDQNAVNRVWATVTGGSRNIASGARSSVNGGFLNTARGGSASVSGGRENVAIGSDSSISGGLQNTAGATGASVSGGFGNTAGAQNSSVSGGQNNEANGPSTSISGGSGNTASNLASSVTGGNDIDLSGACNWGGEDLGVVLAVFGDGMCP